MATEFKGRYANHYWGDRAAGRIDRAFRVSLNKVKTIGGTHMARIILADKEFVISNVQWYELELLPGEKGAEETMRDRRKAKIAGIGRELFRAVASDYTSTSQLRHSGRR